jgi:hypothetical protein
VQLGDVNIDGPVFRRPRCHSESRGSVHLKSANPGRFTTDGIFIRTSTSLTGHVGAGSPSFDWPCSAARRLFHANTWRKVRRPMNVDQSPYSDEPTSFDAVEVRAEFIARVCAFWDLDIFVPAPATLDALADWRDAFDLHPIPRSVAWHTLRSLYGWPAAPSIPPIQDAADPEDKGDPYSDLI